MSSEYLEVDGQPATVSYYDGHSNPTDRANAVKARIEMEGKQPEEVSFATLCARSSVKPEARSEDYVPTFTHGNNQWHYW